MKINYKNREEVPIKYKWDLNFLLESKSIDENIDELIEKYTSLSKMKDSKYESEKALLKALKLEDETIILNNKVNNFLSNWSNENLLDPSPTEKSQRLVFAMEKINEELGAEVPRIFKHKKFIKKCLEKPSFKNYVKSYNEVFKTKKHQLPKVIQEYRTIADAGLMDAASSFEMLTDGELYWNKIADSKGKMHIVNHSTIQTLSKNKDKQLRKASNLEYRKGYLRVKETLSGFLFQKFKSDTVEAKLHKHKDIIAYLTYDDDSNEEIVTSLYKATQDNIGLYKKSSKIHAQIYKSRYGEKMTRYDEMMPIVKANEKMTIEEQQKVVLESLKPFGKEYTDMVSQAYKDKWIDYKSYPGKMTGAYSIGDSYGLEKKLILMNDTGDMRAAETLAHEMGHSMHSYYSDKSNHLRLSEYKIFVAEIASIFNELMLMDHIKTNSSDDKLKLQIVHNQIKGFEGTVFRQVEWSNYEYDLYKKIESGEVSPTYQSIVSVYRENSKKYSLNKKKETDEELWASIMVPHYYYDFYVYKYAIGQLAANIFFARYKNNGEEELQKFIKNFLSVGGSLNPQETLLKNDIDLTDPSVYNIGFETYKNLISEYQSLAKKVYKSK